MPKVQTIERNYTAAPTSMQKMLIAVLIGAVIGLISWGGGVLIAKFIIEPIFCATPDSVAVCEARDLTAFNIALVMASFAGLLAMVRARIYRPLLISIATIISLWGAPSLVAGDPVATQMLWIVLMAALAYAFFSWVGQLKSFMIALIITVVAVIGLRLLPGL